MMMTMIMYRDGMVQTVVTGARWLLGNGRSEVRELCFL